MKIVTTALAGRETARYYPSDRKPDKLRAISRWIAGVVGILVLTAGRPAPVNGVGVLCGNGLLNGSGSLRQSNLLNRSNTLSGSDDRLNKSGPFELHATIAGLKNDSVHAYARVENDQGKIIRIDTFATVARDGRFVLKGTISRPSYAYVYIGTGRSDYFSLILEPGVIQVQGNMRSIQEATVSGTPENDVVKAFSQKEQERYGRIKALYENYSQADAAKRSAIDAMAQGIRDSINKARIGFIEKHPGAMASGIYLYVLQSKLSLQELEKLYNALSPRIKNNSYGNIVADEIAALKRTAIGNTAPPLEMKDMKGNAVSLAALRGRYVLLDFWASWCVPCREEIPAIKAAYQKFKDKGFTVIAISLDNNEQKWLEAVKEEALPWLNTRENLGAPDGVAHLYGVGPIPDNFLIDPGGKIIARGLRGKELASRLAREIR